MNFETIILRFRDLVTENDETIKHHKNKIEENGCVWWGWWNKGNEQTPFNEFSVFMGKVNEKPIYLYLLDSGQKKLYKAQCTSIKYDRTKKIKSPETNNTPLYYSSQKYYAWFRFDEIIACDIKELKNYTYVEIDSLFEDNTANYKSFNNKRIYDEKELIQQNRTLWFVRPYNHETDKDFEIQLINSNFVEPNNYGKKYFETNSDTLLWLSDLHFDNDNIFKIKVENETDTTLTRHLQKAYDKFKYLGGLIITGDITSKGKPEGFSTAKDFLKDINRKLKKQLVSQNIIICPGNHDFIRIEEQLNKDDLFKNVSEYPDNIAPYKEFYQSIHHLSPNKYFSCGRKLLMNNGRTMEIVALNSNVLQQYKNFEGHGFISDEQLDIAAEEMGWKAGTKTNAIRIVIMHHHYLPTCLVEQADVSKSSSVVYDAERLMQWLMDHNVKILLHGHKHQSFFSKVGRINSSADIIKTDDFKEVYIIGMGSTSAGGCENKFATLTFKINELELNYYRIYADNIENDKCVQTIHIPI